MHLLKSKYYSNDINLSFLEFLQLKFEHTPNFVLKSICWLTNNPTIKAIIRSNKTEKSIKLRKLKKK